MNRANLLYRNLNWNHMAFTKNSVVGHDGMMETCHFTPNGVNYLWDEELYPCVGFHFAKGAIVRISRTWAKNPLNDRSKESMEKPGSCPFYNDPSVPTV